VRGTPGDLEEAAAGFESILEDDAAYHLARYWLTKIQLTRGETEKAQANARTLAAAQPHMRIARELLAEVGAAAPGVAAATRSPRTATSRVAGADGAPAGDGRSDLPEPPATSADGGHGLARPVAVLVDWKSGAPTPAGISSAYLVHETPVAKGQSRLLALYRDTLGESKRAGPMAGCDAQAAALARRANALVACVRPKGGAAPWENSVDDRTAPHLFFTDPARSGSSNVFVRLPRLADEASRSGAPSDQTPALAFPRSDRTAGQKTASRSIAIPCQTAGPITFRYDGSTGLYHRLDAEGRDAVDGGDGANLTARNLIVLKGPSWAPGTPIEIHRAGRTAEGKLGDAPEAPLVGAKGQVLTLDAGPIWSIAAGGAPPAARPLRASKPAAPTVARAKPVPARSPTASEALETEGEETPAEDEPPPEALAEKNDATSPESADDDQRSGGRAAGSEALKRLRQVRARHTRKPASPGQI
jgi:hypothetical protein